MAGSSYTDTRRRRGWLRSKKIRKLLLRHGAGSVLALESLWEHVADTSPIRGEIEADCPEDIGLVADATLYCPDVEPEAFGLAMLALGLVEEVEGNYLIHDWQDEQPHIVANNEVAEAKREQRRRAGQKSAQRREEVYGTAQPGGPQPTNPEREPGQRPTETGSVPDVSRTSAERAPNENAVRSNEPEERSESVRTSPERPTERAPNAPEHNRPVPLRTDPYRSVPTRTTPLPPPTPSRRVERCEEGLPAPTTPEEARERHARAELIQRRWNDVARALGPPLVESVVIDDVRRVEEALWRHEDVREGIAEAIQRIECHGVAKWRSKPLKLVDLCDPGKLGNCLNGSWTGEYREPARASPMDLVTRIQRQYEEAERRDPSGEQGQDHPSNTGLIDLLAEGD